MMGRPKGPCNERELAQRRAAAQKRGKRPPDRWDGGELLDLRDAYETPAVKVDAIAAEFRTSRGHMMRLAKRHGWTRRRAPYRYEAALA